MDEIDSPQAYYSSSQSSLSSSDTPSPSPPTNKSKSKSHSRKKPASHIPRPPNAFILFRSDFIEKYKHDIALASSLCSTLPSLCSSASPDRPTNLSSTTTETTTGKTKTSPTKTTKPNQQSISRIAGAVWKALPSSERAIWFERAAQEKSAHAQRFPDYQFSPVSATALYYSSEYIDGEEPGAIGAIRRKRVVKKGRKEEELKAQAEICRDVADAIVRKRVRTHERSPTTTSASASEEVQSEPKTPELENGNRVISVSPQNSMDCDGVDGDHPPRSLEVPSSPVSPLGGFSSGTGAQVNARANISTPTASEPPTSSFSRQSSNSFSAFASKPVTLGFSSPSNASPTPSPSSPPERLSSSLEVHSAATTNNSTPIYTLSTSSPFARASSFSAFASKPVSYGLASSSTPSKVQPTFRPQAPRPEVPAKPAVTTTSSSSGWVSGRLKANPVMGEECWSIRPSAPSERTSRRPLMDLDDDEDDD